MLAHGRTLLRSEAGRHEEQHEQERDGSKARVVI
jgi:hypothetical protein